MDSLTQIVLGAAVGEAVLGKKIGNKALLWGAIAGTIPDLDIILFPFIDTATELRVHRGISHSLFFCILFAPFLAWLIPKFYQKKEANFKEWTLMFFACLVTHPLLDIFTSYGTQFFLPFSEIRLAISSIFVADPFYTVPFLLCIIIASFLHRTSSKRRFINYFGLGLSTSYLLFTVVNQQYVKSVFKTALQEQNITYDRFLNSPMPLNNFLWYGVAKTEKGYQYGYYSIFDKDKNIKFRFLENGENLLNDIENTDEVSTLKWFSNDFFVVRDDGERLNYNDMRFGTLDAWLFLSEPEFVFTFFIKKMDDGKVKLWQDEKIPDIDFKERLSDFWRRMWGRK